MKQEQCEPQSPGAGHKWESGASQRSLQMSRWGDGYDEAWTQGKGRWEKMHGFGNVPKTHEKNQTGLGSDLVVPSGPLKFRIS